MTTEKKNTENQIVELWKALDIATVEFVFYCGGDSMGDTEIHIYDTKGKKVDSDEIADYIDDEVYNRVEFYEASDGHYQGESGTVYITLDDDGESLHFSKSSTSEWCESISSEVGVELGEELANFVREKIININGGYDDWVVNYKQDTILTDREEELLSELKETVKGYLNDYTPEEAEGELSEWYTFHTQDNGNEILFNGNSLVIEVDNQTTVFRDEE